MIAIANLKKQSFECRSCKNKTAVSQVLLPYAAKLLVSLTALDVNHSPLLTDFRPQFQELQSMNIATRIAFESSDHEQRQNLLS